jgi:hypothetical protein
MAFVLSSTSLHTTETRYYSQELAPAKRRNHLYQTKSYMEEMQQQLLIPMLLRMLYGIPTKIQQFIRGCACI